MRETQRAYGEGYAPETHVREGSGFRAPSRRGPPTPCPGSKRRATARPALPAAYWWACGLVLVAGLVLYAVVLHWSQADLEAGRAEAYCAAVYAGQVPDWRGTYFEQCAGPKLKKPRS